MMVQGENLVVLKHDELLAEMVRLNHGLRDHRELAAWIRVNDMSHTVRGSEALNRPEPPAPGSPGHPCYGVREAHLSTERVGG